MKKSILAILVMTATLTQGVDRFGRGFSISCMKNRRDNLYYTDHGEAHSS